MKAFGWIKVNYVNYEQKAYSCTPMFSTVLDSFKGHFDGKEYWTVREEMCCHSYIDDSVYEIVETKTVNSEDYLNKVKRDRELNDLCISDNFKEVK